MKSKTAELALDLRSGLPDALKVLLEEYPRRGWENDPGFRGLVQFWLDRHVMFRRMLERLNADTQLFMDDQLELSAYRRNLAQLGSMFVQELHGHHNIEDHHYFPVLAKLDSRIQKGFDLLDSDHHALDPLLGDFVEGANAVLQPGAKGDKADIAALHHHLNKMERLLNRHLIDEEELVVPVILKHGAAGLA